MFFSGQVKTRNVTMRGNQTETKKSILEKAQKERQERNRQKSFEKSYFVVQSRVRNWLVFKELKGRNLREDLVLFLVSGRGQLTLVNRLMEFVKNGGEDWPGFFNHVNGSDLKDSMSIDDYISPEKRTGYLLKRLLNRVLSSPTSSDYKEFVEYVCQVASEDTAVGAIIKPVFQTLQVLQIFQANGWMDLTVQVAYLGNPYFLGKVLLGDDEFDSSLLTDDFLESILERALPLISDFTTAEKLRLLLQLDKFQLMNRTKRLADVNVQVVAKVLKGVPKQTFWQDYDPEDDEISMNPKYQPCLESLIAESNLRLLENMDSILAAEYLGTVLQLLPSLKLQTSSFILGYFDKTFLPQVIQLAISAVEDEYLYLACALLSRLLATISNDEFFAFTFVEKSDLTKFITVVKDAVYSMYWSNTTLMTEVRKTYAYCLCLLYARDLVNPYCPENHWLIQDLELELLLPQVAFVESPQLDIVKLLLNEIPFVVSFTNRVMLFREYIKQDQRNMPDTDWMPPKIVADIRRDHLFEDGYELLNVAEIKGRVAIQFIDSHGMKEAGIDGGGVFKEFLTNCLNIALDPETGLFKGAQDFKLYPSPTNFAKQEEQLKRYEFLGRIIGKGIYSGVLLDTSFAKFFLAKWLDKRSYYNDLYLLDKELSKGLMFLKTFTGDFDSLGLNFTVTDDNGTQVDLIPNGSNISVNSENRLKYIFLVANYRLNIQIDRQCNAFFRGLADLIQPKWLKMFFEEELQILISGEEKPINVADLKANTVYGGVYDPQHPSIILFWQVVEEMNPQERSNLCKFVTSCTRPPLLGFGALEPKFSIRFAGQEQDRLPSASTCVNLLKLPAYKTKELMKMKLVYAINAQAGFDMS